jgi:hypothetical protein
MEESSSGRVGKHKM